MFSQWIIPNIQIYQEEWFRPLPDTILIHDDATRRIWRSNEEFEVEGIIGLSFVAGEEERAARGKEWRWNKRKSRGYDHWFNTTKSRIPVNRISTGSTMP